MLKVERAEWVMHKLEELYPETPIPLDHKDSYTLLVAVLLSAQCTDARVNLITPVLFELADNPYDMAQRPADQHLARRTVRPELRRLFWMLAATSMWNSVRSDSGLRAGCPNKS